MGWTTLIAVLALLVAVLALWRAEELARFFHVAENTLNNAWKKRMSAQKHNVEHKSDSEADLKYARESDLKFLAEFWGFADHLNKIYSEGAWTFENSGKIDAGPGSMSGTRRTIIIRFNQQMIGRIRLSCIAYPKFPVHLELDIQNARHFPYSDIFEIALTASQPICLSEDFATLKQKINMSMLACAWQVGPGAAGNPDFEFSMSGNAETWLREKDD